MMQNNFVFLEKDEIGEKDVQEFEKEEESFDFKPVQKAKTAVQKNPNLNFYNNRQDDSFEQTHNESSMEVEFRKGMRRGGHNESVESNYGN